MRDDWADLDARAHRDPRREAGERGEDDSARRKPVPGREVAERLANAWQPFEEANERAQDAALTHALKADETARAAPYAAGATGSQDFGAAARGRGGDAGRGAGGTGGAGRASDDTAGAPTVRGYPAYQGTEFADAADFQVAASREGPFERLNEAAEGDRSRNEARGRIGERQARETALAATLSGYDASVRADAAADRRDAAFSGRMAPDSGIIEQAWRSTPAPDMEASRELAETRRPEVGDVASFIQDVWETGPADAAAPRGRLPESVEEAASGSVGESATAGGGTPSAASSAGIPYGAPYGTPALQNATGFGAPPVEASLRDDDGQPGPDAGLRDEAGEPAAGARQRDDDAASPRRRRG